MLRVGRSLGGRAGGLMSAATGQVSLGERGLEPRPVGKGSDHEDVGAEGPLSPGNSQRKGPDGAGAGCPRGEWAVQKAGRCVRVRISGRGEKGGSLRSADSEEPPLHSTDRAGGGVF